jgi:polyisoprenoid-binding protein YceI
MKRALIIAAALSILAIPPAFAAQTTWDVDPAHSSIGFKIRHMMVSNVRGLFGDFAGTLVFDEQDVARSKVEVTIQAASLDTGVEKRDAHLRSPDFLDVEKFPTLSFRSKKVQKAAGDALAVLGDLTIHGVTREVTLDVEGLSARVKDPWGNVKMGAAATTTINRKDFGLTWNKALETGGFLVGEEITIQLDIEWTRRTDEVSQK